MTLSTTPGEEGDRQSGHSHSTTQPNTGHPYPNNKTHFPRPFPPFPRPDILGGVNE